MANNMEKFSFGQLTSNADGKTSASGVMGLLICFIGCISFLLGAIDRIYFTQSTDIMTQTIIFTGIGATLLGVKKWKSPIASPGADQPDDESGEESPRGEDDHWYDKDPYGN